MAWKIIRMGIYHQNPEAQPKPQQVPRGQNRIEIMTGGRAWIQIGGAMKELGAGAILWHQPGEWTIGVNDPKKPYHCLNIQYECRKNISVPRFSQWADLDAVQRFVREVLQLYSSERFDPEILLDYIVHRLRYQVEVFGFRKNPSDLPAGLIKVKELMDSGYGMPLRMSDIAELSGWSVPHLHSIFKLHFKETPHQYLLRKRIEAAREKLVSTNAQIKSISADCGFPNISAFCALFKKHTGMSPVAYRLSQIS